MPGDSLYCMQHKVRMYVLLGNAALHIGSRSNNQNDQKSRGMGIRDRGIEERAIN
jgi:hypothetical protein